LLWSCFPQPAANPITSSSVMKTGTAPLRKRVDSPVKYASIPWGLRGMSSASSHIGNTPPRLHPPRAFAGNRRRAALFFSDVPQRTRIL
jgi:hypothetical protein